jgi:hypothetical protein
MTPYQRRRLRLWLNPLRILCEFGLHRMDGMTITPGVFHCRRCRTPYVGGR